MLIAHLADLHLGYRAYHRQAQDGVNQRERDVAEALARTIDQVVDARPDLVLVAGDVFHTVRPSNGAIMDGFRQFMRLRRGLPSAPVVMIAGNHDSPRSADTGSILRLLGEIPDIHVVDDSARTVRLPDLDAAVLCLPHAALVADDPPRMEADGAATTRILMLHGTVAGTGVDDQLLRLVEYGGAHIDRSGLAEETWDYVALGHYHNATRIASNVWYAGATERTGTNIWAEAETRKGWVLFDTETREGEFRDVRTREVVDLPRFSARRADAPGRAAGGNGGRAAAAGAGDDTEGDAADDAWLSAGEIDRRIRDLAADLPGGVADKIVRLVITDVPRELFRQLDHRQIRTLKADALHFQLDARRPQVRERSTTDQDPRRRTLEEELEEFLAQWEPTIPGVDRERLVSLGAAYLAATEDWRDEALELGLEEGWEGASGARERAAGAREAVAGGDGPGAGSAAGGSGRGGVRGGGTPPGGGTSDGRSTSGGEGTS